MALIAIRTADNAELEAFSIEANEWDTMRREPKGSFLMYGSLWPAVLKRSIRGTQFFAHAPGYTGIKPEPESEEHLQAKAIIIKALRTAGYTAYVERQGITPDGEKWQADVLCNTGRGILAFEIQLSQQTLEVYLARSNRYIRSGVHCVWLVRGGRHYKALSLAIAFAFMQQGKSPYGRPSFPELAAVHLELGDKRNFKAEDMQILALANERVRRFPLDEFVIGVAEGKLVFLDECWQWCT